MDFETILILSAIIEIVTLICFFILCNNMAKVRKQICKDNIPISTILAIYIGFGEKEKARQTLIEHITHETILHEKIFRVEDMNTFLRPYKGLMDELDITFDAEKAKEVKKSRINRQ